MDANTAYGYEYNDDGINVHTIGNPNRAYVIASVMTPAMTMEQAEREHHARIRCMVNNYGVDKPITLEGAYKGTLEPSMAIDAADWPSVAHLFNNQESVLYIDSVNQRFAAGMGRRARLIYVGTGEFEDIGIFRVVPGSSTIGAEAYTYDPATETFYMVD